MIRRTLAAAALAVALSSSPASAQFSSASWIGQCTTGSLQACASVSIGLAYDSSRDRTTVVVGISNLQGLDWWRPNPGRYQIADLFFEGLECVGPHCHEQDGDFSLAPGRNTFAVGNADLGGLFGEMQWDDPFGSMWVGPQQGSNGVWGCDQAPPELRNGGLAYTPWTCGGWIQITYDFRNHLSVGANTRVTINATNFASTARCTTGVNCNVVTPEPGTMLLLGSGLLGFAVVRRRRKIGGPA